MLVSVKIPWLLTLLIRPRVRQNKASSEMNNRTAGSSEKTVTTTSEQLEISIWLRWETLTIVNISECWVMPCCDDMHRLSIHSRDWIIQLPLLPLLRLWDTWVGSAACWSKILISWQGTGINRKQKTVCAVSRNPDLILTFSLTSKFNGSKK